jgi:hypothetical protein
MELMELMDSLFYIFALFLIGNVDFIVLADCLPCSIQS